MELLCGCLLAKDLIHWVEGTHKGMPLLIGDRVYCQTKGILSDTPA
jgi:hypothetical protein